MQCAVSASVRIFTKFSMSMNTFTTSQRKYEWIRLSFSIWRVTTRAEVSSQQSVSVCWCIQTSNTKLPSWTRRCRGETELQIKAWERWRRRSRPCSMRWEDGGWDKWKPLQRRRRGMEKKTNTHTHTQQRSYFHLLHGFQENVVFLLHTGNLNGPSCSCFIKQSENCWKCISFLICILFLH